MRLIDRIRKRMVPIGVACLVGGLTFAGYNSLKKERILKEDSTVKTAIEYEKRAYKNYMEMLELRYMNSEGKTFSGGKPIYNYEKLKERYEELMEGSYQMGDEYMELLTSKKIREDIGELKIIEGNYASGRNLAVGGLLFICIGIAEKIKKSLDKKTRLKQTVEAD